MTPERAAFYLDRLRSESVRLAEVGRKGPDADVPNCPGWTVGDVVRHVATVYLHKVEVLRLGALPDEWPPDFDGRDSLELSDEARAAIGSALWGRAPLPAVRYAGDERVVREFRERLAECST